MTKFIPKKYNQIQLTKALAAQANLGPGEWQTLRRTIWFNPVDDNSLRLNHNGFSFLKRCGYKNYEIEISPHFLANKHLLALERFFPGVYLLVNAKKIIVLTPLSADFLSDKFGVVSSRLCVIHHSLKTAEYKNVSQERIDRIRKDLDLKADEPVIGMVSRFE